MCVSEALPAIPAHKKGIRSQRKGAWLWSTQSGSIQRLTGIIIPSRFVSEWDVLGGEHGHRPPHKGSGSRSKAKRHDIVPAMEGGGLQDVQASTRKQQGYKVQLQSCFTHKARAPYLLSITARCLWAMEPRCLASLCQSHANMSRVELMPAVAAACSRLHC